MRKGDERDDPNSTWNKVPDDEPIFILRAQDALAVPLVIHWCVLATILDVPPAKVAAGQKLADAMTQWQEENEKEEERL